MVLVSTKREGLKMMKIEDNFLDQKEFNELQNFLMGNMIVWHYNPIIDFQDDKDKFQFIHIFYNNYAPTDASVERINPILTKVCPLAIWRIKANLLTKTPNIIENEFHVDMQKIYKDGVDIDFDRKKILKQSTTSIFYVNTNNGYTKFEDGTKVESVANRLVSFPSNMKHKGTSCTDEKIRVVINFNYF